MKIKSKIDYISLINKMTKCANEVKGTYETIGASVSVFATTEEVKEIFKISDDFEREFVDAISTFKKKELGPYITEKYFMLIPSLKRAMKQLVDDCLETRRCVIDFPPEHCFQSIQFLLRENTVHVVCYMRSCNAIKNLPHDVWICSKMADIFAHYLSEISEEHPYQYHQITMMFGSLHIYKEEINSVL